MIMTATVIRVDNRGLLVRDMSIGQEVYVHTNMARQFRAGDVVRIRYNGIMNPSISPQISAQSITRISQQCGCRPGGCAPGGYRPSGYWPSGCQSGGSCNSSGCRPSCRR